MRANKQNKWVTSRAPTRTGTAKRQLCITMTAQVAPPQQTEFFLALEIDRWTKYGAGEERRGLFGKAPTQA
jgi:hypothetical protein